MPTVAKTWAFASDAEGLADAGVSAVVFAHLSSDGNPSGCVRFTQGTKAATHTERALRASTGETWETWGVPAGAAVTDVQITAWQERLVANTKLSSHSISARIVGSGGSTVHSAGDLLAGVALGTTTDASWQAGAAGTQRSVDSGAQASTTDVRLELEYSVTTSGGGGSASVDQRFDQIELTITYTEPPASQDWNQDAAGDATTDAPDASLDPGTVPWSPGAAGEATADAADPALGASGAISWSPGGAVEAAAEGIDPQLAPAGAATWSAADLGESTATVLDPTFGSPPQGWQPADLAESTVDAVDPALAPGPVSWSLASADANTDAVDASLMPSPVSWPPAAGDATADAVDPALTPSAAIWVTADVGDASAEALDGAFESGSAGQTWGPAATADATADGVSPALAAGPATWLADIGEAAADALAGQFTNLSYEPPGPGELACGSVVILGGLLGAGNVEVRKP